MATPPKASLRQSVRATTAASYGQDRSSPPLRLKAKRPKARASARSVSSAVQKRPEHAQEPALVPPAPPPRQEAWLPLAASSVPKRRATKAQDSSAACSAPSVPWPAAAGPSARSPAPAIAAPQLPVVLASSALPVTTPAPPAGSSRPRSASGSTPAAVACSSVQPSLGAGRDDRRTCLCERRSGDAHGATSWRLIG
jgi:hypothetical protein